MQLARYHDVKAFGKHVLPKLLKNEAQNNLMIGILLRAMAKDEPVDWLMATVEEEREIVLVALMTPPRNILLDGSEDPQALALLCESVEQCPGVFAPKRLARAFAECCKRPFEVHMEERAYELTEVQPVRRMGVLRAACESDMVFMPYWIKAFEDEAFGTVNELKPEWAQQMIALGSLYVLEVDGLPVCLAGNCRKTPGGSAIGPVYTPPFFRNRGYAADCVAQLSQLLLDRGSAFCALFTDLKNPASNSAYIRAGYRAVCDFSELSFVE